jgi:hypothetical protein
MWDVWGKKCGHGFGGETRGEDLGVDGKTVLKWFFKKYDGGREMD